MKINSNINPKIMDELEHKENFQELQALFNEIDNFAERLCKHSRGDIPTCNKYLVLECRGGDRVFEIDFQIEYAPSFEDYLKRVETDYFTKETKPLYTIGLTEVFNYSADEYPEIAEEYGLEEGDSIALPSEEICDYYSMSLEELYNFLKENSTSYYFDNGEDTAWRTDRRKTPKAEQEQQNNIRKM